MSQPTKKISKNKASRAEWEKAKDDPSHPLHNQYRPIPECVNSGCDREVAIRDWKNSGIPSVKTECSRCSTSRIKGKPLTKIIIHKKNFCENKDGLLGFLCPLDPERYEHLPGAVYDMDHIDADHFNNDPENLQTLCKVCHAMKGDRDGDFNSRRHSSRILKH